MTSKHRIIVAVAGALSLGAATSMVSAQTQDQRIQELETKIAQLEARQAANSADIAATVDAVLRDAERRSQLLATTGDASAGYDNGFFIRAGDSWILRPTAQFQFRYVANWRDELGDDADEGWENGFEVRRMKFGLEGVAFTPSLTYKFVWATEREGGALLLEDAWAKYMFSPDWGIRVGQFKSPVHHEELVSSRYQLAVDRSLLNEELGGGISDWTQGVALIYGNYERDNPLYAEIAFTEGSGQRNTNFTELDFDFGVAARVEYKLFGEWRDYADFSARGNREDLLVIGAGAAWDQSGAFDRFLATVDAQYETTGGLGVYGAALLEYIDFGDNPVNWGLLAQAGYLLSPQWELFGRADFLFYDFDQVGSRDFFQEYTIGVNYYLGTNGSAGHRAKLTLDLTWLPNGTPGSHSGIGILGQETDDDQVIIRGQFQLLI
jgi:hypothetical protein